MKQGGASVGIISKEYAVLATLRRAESELASYTQKIFKIDDHVGVAISGLIPDGRSLAKTMREECLEEKWRFDAPIPVGRLVASLSDQNQILTQSTSSRPVGVGLLVIGYDRMGPHLFETSPSGTFYEYRAQAIGARSQSCKTYLENHIDEFPGQSLKELLISAVRALKGASQDKLTTSNVCLAYVGKGAKFTLLEDDATSEYVDAVADEAADAARAGPGAGRPGPSASAAPASTSSSTSAIVTVDSDDE